MTVSNEQTSVIPAARCDCGSAGYTSHWDLNALCPRNVLRARLALLADTLDIAASDYRNQSMPSARKHGYGHAITADFHDLKKIAHAVRVGKLVKAQVLAYHIDTIVRDVIPQDVWNTIQAAK